MQPRSADQRHHNILQSPYQGQAKNNADVEHILRVVGKSSRRRDPVEFSGTFWNISLV